MAAEYAPVPRPPHYFLFADGVVIGSRFGEEATHAVVALLAAKRPDVTFGYCPSPLWGVEQHRLMVEAGERYGLPAIPRGG